MGENDQIDLTQTESEDLLWINCALEWGLEMDSCGHGNELTGFIESRKFLDSWANIYISKRTVVRGLNEAGSGPRLQTQIQCRI
jgi:hypothetical protein